MNQVIEFFERLLDSSDWPPRWHCGRWTEFHGWLYIISDLLIWSAYFTIPFVIIRYLAKRKDIKFARLYFLFAAFILACGATHFLDAVAFWIPLYRLNGLARLITGVISWITVFSLIHYLPVIFSLRTQKELETEIDQRKRSEEKFMGLLEAAPDAIIIANEKRNIVLVNRQTVKLFGYTKNELIGKPVEILIPGDFMHKYIVDGTKYFAGPEVKPAAEAVELNAVKKSGIVFPSEISISPLVTEDGTLISASVRDITERKKVENNLNNLYNELIFQVTEKEKRAAELSETLERVSFLASIAANIQDPVISTDNKTIITRWNKPAEKLLEWKSEEVIGKTILKILKTSPLLKSRKEIFESLKVKSGWQGENIFYTRSGKPLNVLLTASRLKDAEGRVTGYLVLVRDITERKMAEEALSKLNKELEERVKERTEKLASGEIRFRSLIENSAEGIALTDEFSNIIYRSPASVKITGIQPTKNTLDFAHPEDRELIKSKLTETKQNPGVPILFQGRFLHAAGHYFWMEGTLTNLLNVEGINAIVSNYRDITQRKETEEKLIKSEKIYKTIASGIPGSVICLLDLDYRYLLIEGDMLAKLGYVKNTLLGNKAEDVLSPEIFARVKKDFNKALEGETVTRESSSLGYDIIVRVIPLKDEKNSVYAFMTVAMDVTELKNAQRDIIELNRGLEEKINQRTAQLESVNKELESFSYSVSHDLRAPLRIIDGFGQILLEDYSQQLDNEGRQTVNVIVSSARKMGQLIDDLLNFSKLGRAEIRISRVDMNQLVDEAISELKTSGISVPAGLICNKLEKAKGDRNLLKQVWINLLSNAIKYSAAKKDPIIEIGMMGEVNKGIYYVRDNGAGFDIQYAGKLFGVFQRLHKEEEFAGTGVGLALVQRIIVRHGGKIWAEAQEDKGATFYFSLESEKNMGDL